MDFFKKIDFPTLPTLPSNNTIITCLSGTTILGTCFYFYKRYYNTNIYKSHSNIINNIPSIPPIPKIESKSWCDTVSSFIKTPTIIDLYPIMNINNILNNNSNIYSILIGCNYNDTPYEVSNSIENVNSIQKYILDTTYSKYNIRNPLIITDNKSSSNKITNSLEYISNIYNKCKDGDFVFIYYSGYCDYLDDTKEDVLTILSETSPKIKIESISINSILEIFENPNIKLILFIDGFYYNAINKNSNQKSNHLILSSFINDKDKPTRYANTTKTTKSLLDILNNENKLEYNHKIWSSINVIGNQKLIYDNI